MFLRLPLLSNHTSPKWSLKVVGSCNGLVCCIVIIKIENDWKGNSTTELEEDDAPVFRQLIVVWNPKTGQFRCLPNNIPLGGRYNTFQGRLFVLSFYRF